MVFPTEILLNDVLICHVMAFHFLPFTALSLMAKFDGKVSNRTYLICSNVAAHVTSFTEGQTNTWLSTVSLLNHWQYALVSLCGFTKHKNKHISVIAKEQAMSAKSRLNRPHKIYICFLKYFHFKKIYISACKWHRWEEMLLLFNLSLGNNLFVTTNPFLIWHRVQGGEVLAQTRSRFQATSTCSNPVVKELHKSMLNGDCAAIGCRL